MREHSFPRRAARGKKREEREQMKTNTTNTPKTFAEIVREKKCRRGKASGIDESGAYWNAIKITTKMSGGTGIGNSEPQVSFYLEARHYRAGQIMIGVVRESLHQNYNDVFEWIDTPSISEADSVESVIVGLRAKDLLSSYHQKRLVEALTALGLPEAPPSPDDIS